MPRNDDKPIPWGLVGIGLGAILVGATLLRFVDLATNPGGLYMDEAVEGLSALRLLHEPGFHPVFFADGGGREALFAYVVAGTFSLIGETPLALRATAAGIGVAGVLGIWILARRFGQLAGLTAAAWAAGSLWLICVSRDGMRNTLVPLFGAIALAALIAWYDRPSRATAILAGATTSLAALYTYQPLKLLPLLVVVWLAWLYRADRAAYGRLRAGLPAFVVAFLVVGAPMIAAAVADPVSYFGRAAGVTFNPGAEIDLVGHWLRTLGMFGLTGDPNPRHDVAQLPLLAWPLVPIAVAGIVRLWRLRHDPAHALVLWSLPIFLLPPLVATEGGAPHFLRALGLAAPLAVTIGAGVAELVGWVRAWWSGAAAGLAAGAVAVGLLALAVGSGQAYLSRSVGDRYEAYRFDLAAMAAAAGPGDTVLLDDYTATAVLFIDAAHPPSVVVPGVALADPQRGRVLALTLDDLRRALGRAGAAKAVVLARDPQGDPAVWVVAP